MTASDSLAPLFARVVRPLQRFFQLEAASGLVLLASAAIALTWANSPFAQLYHDLFAFPLALGWNGHVFHFSLHTLINDGLMAVFFLVVGMEIKRELVSGELQTFGRAVLPALAALGGMVVPALVFVGFNHGTAAARGWAIPMATDIAFAIGTLTLLKGRVPSSLVVLITALAIFDDLGGILVIALFYGTGLKLAWLVAALALALLLVGLGRLGLRSPLLYLVALPPLWYLVHLSGLHATIAGVLMGFAVPAHTRRKPREVLRELELHAADCLAASDTDDLASAELREIAERLDELQSPLDRLVHVLHPWVAFGIMPVFALANSGVRLEGLGLSALASPVLLGAGLGLFVGKQLGVFTFAAAATKLGISPMPEGSDARQLYGVSVLAGIGFTVALFIATLAFADAPALLAEAKLGVLLGSLVSGVSGFAFLRGLSARRLVEPRPAG